MTRKLAISFLSALILLTICCSAFADGAINGRHEAAGNQQINDNIKTVVAFDSLAFSANGYSQYAYSSGAWLLVPLVERSFYVCVYVQIGGVFDWFSSGDYAALFLQRRKISDDSIVEETPIARANAFGRPAEAISQMSLSGSAIVRIAYDEYLCVVAIQKSGGQKIVLSGNVSAFHIQ